MSKIVALKLASDLALGILEAMVTVQKINTLMAELEEGKRDMTDLDWQKVALDTKDANDKLAAARKAAGFTQ